MQVCQKCGASWNTKLNVDICPFCGNNLPCENEKQIIKKIETMEDAFAVISEKNGLDIFLNENKLIAIIGDYAPNLNKEKRLVKIAVQSGAFSSIYNADSAKRLNTVKKYKSILINSYFIDEIWAEKVLLWFYNLLEPNNTIELSENQDEKLNSENNFSASIKSDYNSNSNNTLEFFKDQFNSYKIEYDKFDINNGVLIKYKGKEENVCIPDNVHTISGAAFKDNRFTIRVFIPNTVRHIESYAFHNCFYLQNVYFEDGGNLKTIKPFVFEDDRSLLSVIIPSSVKSIGDHAFSECCNLNEVRFMNGLEIINNFAFKGCKSLNKIDLPMSLKEVGSYAFIGCLPAKIEYPQHISDKFIQTMYYYSDVEKQQLPNGKIQCILITQSDI